MTARPFQGALLATLLVAVMLPLPATDAQSSTTYPDLTITDLKILGDIPEWIDGEATPATVEVQATIYNRGGTPATGYRIDYFWVDSQGTHWLNGGELNSTDIYDEPEEIGKEQSHEHPPMTWRIQPDQRGDGALRAELSQVTPYDRYSSNNQFTNTTFLEIHDLQVTIPGPSQELHNPGETRFVRVNIHNAGNVLDSVDLAILDEQVQPANRHGDVTPYLQTTTLTVDPGETEESTLFVDYIFSGDDGEFTATYDIEAVTSYGRTLRVTTPVFTGVGGNQAPPDGSPVDLDRTDSDRLTAPLSGNVTRSFSVTNTGTLRDSYTVTPDTDPGWTATVRLPGLDDRPSIRVALEPGESQDFRITLQAPGDAVAGQPTDAGVKVESDHGADDVQRTWPFRVDGPSVRIEPAVDWNLEPYCGDPIRASVVVHNDGTQWTPDPSHLRLVVSEGDDASAMLANPDPIEGGTSEPMQLQLPEVFTGEGPMVFTVEWLTPGTSIHKELLEVDGFIRVPDVVITSADGLTGAPGETVRYRNGDHAFVIQNGGNARETFVVQTLTDGGDVQRVTDGPVTLDPGQQRTIPIDHDLPLPTGPTKHINVSLQVWVDGRPDLNWTSNTTTDILDQASPLIDAGTLPVEWALDGNLSIDAVVTDDSAARWVNITHTAPDGTPTVHSMSPDQDEDAEQDSWTADITLDAVGDHAFSMRATDIHGNNATLDLGKVNVWPIPAPELELVGPGEGVIVSPNTTYQVNVSDERPIALVSVLLEDGDGETTWEADLDLAQDVLTFNLSEAPNGPLTITVDAVNDVGAKATAVRNVTMEGQPEKAAPTDDDDGPGEEKSTPFPSLAVFLAALAALLRRMGRRTVPSPTDGRRAATTVSHSSPGVPTTTRRIDRPESPLATHSMHVAPEPQAGDLP